MNRYTIYCTEEQTKKALKVDAPIKITYCAVDLYNREYIIGENKCTAIIIPTAEEMLGWMEEQGKITVKVEHFDEEDTNWIFVIFTFNERQWVTDGKNFYSRKEATLAAIDAALDYLLKQK